jgi:hypothetical protein
MIHDNTNVRRFDIQLGDEGDLLLNFTTSGGAKYALEALKSHLVDDYYILPHPQISDSSAVRSNPDTLKTLIISVTDEKDRIKAISLIQEFIASKTNIIRYNIKLLERGDYLIHFASPASRKIASEAISAYGNNKITIRRTGVPRTSYISNKKTWEIAVLEVPPFITVTDLESHTGALKGFRRHRNMILRFSDKELAASLCSSGIIFENLFLRCAPWTSLPREFQTPKDVCSRCLSHEHNSSDCKETKPICVKCQGSHLSHQCPAAKDALSRKRKTYAQALLCSPGNGVSSKPLSTWNTPQLIATNTDADSKEVVSTTPHNNMSSLISDYAREIDLLRSTVSQLQAQVQQLSSELANRSLPTKSPQESILPLTQTSPKGERAYHRAVAVLHERKSLKEALRLLENEYNVDQGYESEPTPSPVNRRQGRTKQFKHKKKESPYALAIESLKQSQCNMEVLKPVVSLLEDMDCAADELDSDDAMSNLHA